MPEVEPAAHKSVPSAFKKSTSKTAILKEVAARFHAFLVEHGGLDSWEAAAREDAGLEASGLANEEAEDYVFEALGLSTVPEGWRPWDFALHPLEHQPVMAVKRVCSPNVKLAHDTMVPVAELKVHKEKVVKPKKPKAPQRPTGVREVFDAKLAELLKDPSSLHKPWMETHSLRLVTTAEDLQAWVDRINGDFSIWHPNPEGITMPVVAVDTETFGTLSGTGLDTRLVNGRPQIDIAGLCLCADGKVSIYVPINHEDGNNLSRTEARRILQPLFDNSYLVFFNSKFDREVLRITMGMTFRDYPYFEDVQVDNYLLDPKADLDEEVADFEGRGLKDLAKKYIGMEQIELNELCLVKAQYIHPVTKAKSWRNFLAPFNWVPTALAVKYAAGDSLTTWLLWEQKHLASQKMKFPFKLDHMLVDSLTWVERQRFCIDIPRLQKTIALHHRKMEQFRKELEKLSGVADFNPGSPKQLGMVLFEKLGFKKGKVSVKTGEASTDKTVLDDLKKENPNDPFLIALGRYRSYASLHPANLEFDPRDNSARMFFKQCTVAGGRLAAQGGGKKENSKGGKGKDDGGFGLNPQAIKGVKGLKPVTGHAIILPVGIDELFDPSWLSPVPIEALHESVLKKINGVLTIEAPDVVNGVANYMGQWWSFRQEPVLHATTSEEARKKGFDDIIELKVEELAQTKIDSNEVINLRGLFVAPEGYSFFVTDYSNIEMRVAANVSGEPAFIAEFLTGSGDFHTLTAKAVFPEFSTTTDKAFRKTLRDLAKIINFALLYGGTEHTIYENMKKQDPTITKEKAKAMVDKYWEAVPQFAEWANNMRRIAREFLTCKTPDNRVIDFRSALEAEGLHKPFEADLYKNTRIYYDLKRRGDELEKAGKVESAREVREKALKLWNDPDLGVRNSSEYKKMTGKFERVAVNAPLQGLAGDFMRKALVMIHRWAERAGVEGALLVHASVHDEVDFSIKNEYVPYILPRITRLMKLREIHRAKKWPVPIECDCEYGASWDVKEHLTGDDGHPTAAYTKVPGLEHYLPPVFDPETEAGLIAVVRSGDETAVAEVVAFLKETLHPRCLDLSEFKKGTMGTVIDRISYHRENPAESYRFFCAALQLHEYWTLDEHEDEATDETLEAYMGRRGLTPFPGLGQHVLSSVLVETLGPLGPQDLREPVPETEGDPEGEPRNAFEGDSTASYVFPVTAPLSTPPPAAAVAPEAPEGEPWEEPPPTPDVPSRPMTPLLQDGIPVLRSMSLPELKSMIAGLSLGSVTCRAFFRGKELTLMMRGRAIPECYLQMVEVDG